MADNSSDTSLASIAPCEICAHYAVDEMNAHYVEHHSMRELRAWMKKNKIFEKFSNEDMKKHFHYHIGQFITKMKSDREKELRLQKLNETAVAAEKDSSLRVLTIQQIAFERIMKIKEESDSVTPEEYRAMSMRRSKEFEGLAKVYKETEQLRLEKIGVGKTEEEIKAAIEDYVSIMLKKASAALEGMPEAQDKLRLIIENELHPENKYNDVGGFMTKKDEENN
jgi:hypothetical protein